MIKIGDKTPHGKLKHFDGSNFHEVTFPDHLVGKKVILFGLPGAYTPTCDMKHLPGFIKSYEAIKAKGVDEIICIAVNDVFVLHAWAESTGAKGKVTILSDWDASLTKAMGMEFDGSANGLGIRSLRYNAIVEDGVLKHMIMEENPGACGLTKADEIINYL